MTIEDAGYLRMGGRRVVDVHNDALSDPLDDWQTFAHGGEHAENVKVQVARFGSMERAFAYLDGRAAVAELSMLVGDDQYGDYLLERMRVALDLLAKPRPVRNHPTTGGRI